MSEIALLDQVPKEDREAVYKAIQLFVGMKRTRDDHIASLEAELKKARECLEWYGDASSLNIRFAKEGGLFDWVSDNGQRARECLTASRNNSDKTRE